MSPYMCTLKLYINICMTWYMYNKCKHIHTCTRLVPLLGDLVYSMGKIANITRCHTSYRYSTILC